MTLLEPLFRHPGRRLHGVHRFGRLGHQEGTVGSAEETRALEGFDFEILAAGRALADVDERRHIGMPRSQRPRDYRTDMRRRDWLRGYIAGVPMILVTRVQNEAEIPRPECADEGAV